MKESIKPFLSRIWVKLLLLVALLLALLVFGYILHEVVIEQEQRLDQVIFHWVDGYKSPELISFMKLITFFGSSWFLFPAYVVLATFLLYRRRFSIAVNISILGISSTALMHGMKLYFQRNRPDLPMIKALKDYSFPSGHALSSFIFCSILAWLVWQIRLPVGLKYFFTVVLLILALLIGFSRVVLNVHYPSDVIGGLALGIAWVLLSLTLLNRFNRQKPVHQP